MRILLYVFSGTGNTFAIANLYKKYFEETEDNFVTIYRISEKSEEVPSPEGFDIVGLGYPIHAFSAPEPVIQLCKNLPECKGKKTFIFKTSGEGLHLNDFSSQKCIKILKKKGYDISLERHIVMPYNMIFRHNDEMAKHMWIYAHALVDINCREILEDKHEKVKKSAILGCWMPPIRFLEQKFAHMHGTAFKVEKDKCMHCNNCVNICPQNNIRIVDGEYKFGHNCVLCMGCSFGCPKDAIKVGVFKYWKVNGSYRLNELKADENLQFPYIPDSAKGIYKIYKKYYRECDKRLKDAGVDINNYV